ncbi:MAG: glycoside hydrolase family 2 [Verrucomicrobiales bacterium]|nr:glycoside hydrolase family 2 [Verrucomicrobiales bacterium]
MKHHHTRWTGALSALRLGLLGGLLSLGGYQAAMGATPATVPLPEHPRPDFERTAWQNLNGKWEFRFDGENLGEREGWGKGTTAFPDRIIVPFPWGSKLSGVENRADLAWYAREVTVPAAWRGQRVYLVVGACDWLTRGWLDGESLGEHRGGYTPFEFELTPFVRWGQAQRLVLRVDDSKHPFKLEGKQGYGEAKGIWQTVYLEARPTTHFQAVRFVPDLDGAKVKATLSLNQAAEANTSIRLTFKTGGVPVATQPVSAGAREVAFEVPLPAPRRWSLDDPFLYEVEAALVTAEGEDRVGSYFGLRKISVMDLPGTEFPYVALNDRPVYLQMALDQSYHPEGFYTFPSDDFMRDEILRSRRLGLNANRFHVKIDVPRKLYWADRLGLLIMADVPNSWGEPDAEMRREIEHALRGMIARDFNHPSIFSWVPFNETWGLFTKQGDQRVYLPETQEWVASIYRLAKELDPTRLVEDNSPCNYDHVETDLNTWHAYLPGWAWREHLDQVTRDTFPGSTWNFIGGRKQARQPLLNSECGNVWGYEGSTGDVDWSWDYHLMMNEFRRHPKIGGWLYTEHHDVINEWNGYYRYDRSDKFTGLEELFPGMTLADLHAPFYLSTGSDLCRDAKPGETVRVPLFASFMTDTAPATKLVLRSELVAWDTLGRMRQWNRGGAELPFHPWLATELPDLKVPMPALPCVAVLRLTLETPAGRVLHRNFTTFRVAEGPAPRDETLKTEAGTARVVRFAPASFRDARWSLKQWNVLDGLKVNGAGHGHFEYRVAWPDGLEPGKVAGATFLMEASAKELFAKDRADSAFRDVDYMRGEGVAHRSQNPNSYPMTDTEPFPSAVRVRINGVAAGTCELADDPADHRGILSWHAQLRDRKLREAGSYGYLVSVTVPPAALAAAAAARELVVRLEVDASLPGGLAIYGERFGRYPVEPTLVFSLK